jgi:hypothetical protein
MEERKSFRVPLALGVVAAAVVMGAAAHAGNTIATSVARCHIDQRATKQPLGISVGAAGGSFGGGGFGSFEFDGLGGRGVVGETTEVVCPADNNSSIPVPSRLTADVENGTSAPSDAVTVRPCVTFLGGFGSECSASGSSSAMGRVQFDTPPTAWMNHPVDYRWLVFFVRRTTPTNKIFGYRQF